MIGTSNPPFRAEHVGSLLRPPELRQAFRARGSGEIDSEAFALLQDEAVRSVVEMQESIGLGVITDGEFRRASYWAHVIDAVDGLTVEPATFSFRDAAGGTQSFFAPHVRSRLHRRNGFSISEYKFLAKTARHSIPKTTLPAPSTFHFWRGPDGFDKNAYEGPEQLLRDVATIMRAEILELANLGCRYVQFDEVALIMLADPDIRQAVISRGENPDELMCIYIDAINFAISDRPAGMQIGLHICRGNFKGKFLSTGGYDRIAERVFNETLVNTLFLEYDSERAGDFSSLRFVPNQKGVVLGIVSSKTPVLEEKQHLLRRIDEAAKVMPLDRLAVSPQCGFASAVSGNPLGMADQEAKLRLVVEVARECWKSN